jgi:acetyl-CoA acetyltransferase
MYEYGTTFEHLGHVALAARAWANLNPDACYYGKEWSMADYEASPWVVRPIRRMDCCIQCDLGASIIVTTAERARTLRRPPVYVKGMGFGDHARKQWWENSHYAQLDGAFALRQALETAGLSLADIDVAELNDPFTIEVLLHLEDYGWCAKGESGDFVASGAIGPGGSIPMNTYGGLLAGMYLFDFPAVVEAVTQLRGMAGQRQVHDAEVAVTNGHGGELLHPGMCSSHATMILANATGA